MERIIKAIVNKERKKIKVNLLTTAVIVKIEDLKQKRYILLKGEL